MASSATAELTDWSNDSTHTKSLSEGDPGRIAIWPAIQMWCVDPLRPPRISSPIGIPVYALPVEAPANLELDPARTGVPGEAIRARSAFSDGKDRLGS